jgi:hypothetical protein
MPLGFAHLPDHAQTLALDLSHPLPGNAELGADFRQRVLLAVQHPGSHP